MTMESGAAGIEGIPLAVLDRSGLATLLLDERDRVVFFSRAAELLWGIRREEVLGQDVGQRLALELRTGGGLPRLGLGPLPGPGGDLVFLRRDGLRVDALFSRATLELDGRSLQLVVVQPHDSVPDESRHSRQLLMAINCANRPVLVFDAQRRIVHVNPAFEDLCGYTAGEVLGRDPTTFLPSPLMPAEELAQHLALPWGRERFQTELQVRRKNGHDLWIRISSSPFEGGESELSGYSVDVLQDITEERQIRDLERDVLAALTSNLPFNELGEYLCRRIESIAPGVLVSVCRVAERRLRPWAAPSFHASYGPDWEGVEIGEGVAGCGTCAHRGEPVMVHDIETDPLWEPYKHQMLPHGYKACWTYPVKHSDGSVTGTFAFYFHKYGGPDMQLERIAAASVHLCALAIEREESRQRLNQLVQYDALTGLPNRGHLHRHLDELLAAASGREIAFFHLGIDRFRDINDTLGHAAGDQALVEMANRLKWQLSADQFLAYPEGNSFVLVVPDCDAHQATRVAERIQQVVRAPINVSGFELDLTASIGISQYPSGGREREALLNNAKNAMNRVKESGGGNFQFFSLEMNLVALDRLLLGAALRRAIAAGRLSLHYQPQVGTDSGSLHGFEALARWHDEEFGNVAPDRFIPLAEEIGQIDVLGRWALREACRQLAEWRDAGMAVPVVSVNLSPINFQSRDLPGFVAAVLGEHGLAGDSLTIELTESTMVALTPEMLEVVHGIRALGVGLSVDDFGTGFSSLSNLVNLPVTEIKIDRSFIDRCLEESQLQALVKAVVGIGRSLGLTVVAEGVETDAQCALLGEYRCPVIQGYLFSRPLQPREALAWLSGERDRSARGLREAGELARA